jgi:hypothetical protein
LGRQKITMGPGGKLNVFDNPIVLFVEGDIWAASIRVFDQEQWMWLEELGENMEEGSAGVGASSELIKLRRG